MAIYLVTGKLRSGKTLACVGCIRDALLAGKRVATNLDLNLEELLPKRNPLKGEGEERRTKFDVVRIPDKPTVADLDAMGLGFEGEYNEDKNGLLVLDELGAWLNTRTFQDKQRMPVIDWMLHSGKKGWDVYFIIQHANMIDKQVREGLAEFHVTCKRLDRMRVPLLGRLFGLFGLKLMMPKIHVASVRYGLEAQSMVSDTWVYRGRDLYKAYDTRQVFTDRRGDETFTPACYEQAGGRTQVKALPGPDTIQAGWTYSPAKIAGAASGPYSLLSPWHTVGRYLSPELTMSQQLAMVWDVIQNGPPRPKLTPKPKHPLLQLVAQLPVDQRIKHVRRLESLGVLSGGGGALTCV